MNIFEFLGLPHDHRAKPFQLVKHQVEVPASKRTLPVYGQVKRDGVFAAVVCTDHDVRIFNRTGKYMTNVIMLEEKYREFPKGIYLGELLTTFEGAALEELSGIVNPNRVEPLNERQRDIREGLYIDFFDCISTEAFIRGIDGTGFVQRHYNLVSRLGNIIHPKGFNILPYTELNSEDEVQAYADAWIARGQEGAVFKHDVSYECGHKGWRQYKIVRGVSYDLECIGWEEGKGKYAGKVANLLFRWKDGKTVKAMLGKGWSHEDAALMYQKIKQGIQTPVGKIFAVKALQESSKGVLRLPKVGAFRYDKDEPDV